MTVKTSKTRESSVSSVTAPVRAYEPARLTPAEHAASLGSALGVGAFMLFLVMIGVLYIQSLGMFVLPSL